MRNFFKLEDALRRAYVETESTDSGQDTIDPELADHDAREIFAEVVPVDIFVPGCPPAADTIFYVLAELAQGRKPELKDEKLSWL